jgi:hypothetical protein
MSVVMDSPPWGDYVFLRAENFPRFKEPARNFAKNAREFRDKAVTGARSFASAWHRHGAVLG